VKKHLPVVIAFALGVVLANRVRSLPFGSNIPSL
jgi:hypothetical protein